MLGYLQKEDRVFLMDNARNVVSFRVLLSVLQFQTAVVRGDMAAANALVPALPEAEHSTVARFLESQGLKDEALSLTKDPDQKFDLALELGRLEVATQLLAEVVGARGEADVLYSRTNLVHLPDTQLLWEIYI
jgi:coatomer subunit beta'